MTSPRENLLWPSKSLLTSIRKKTSLYSKAKRTNNVAKYKLCKRQTQRAIRSARWYFLKNKLSESLEQNKIKTTLALYQIKTSGWKWCLSFEGKRPAAFR